MFNTMQEVIAANKAIGHHWFNTDTKQFFKSRIGSELYSNKYFITSERDWVGARLYSIRIVKSNGGISTVSEFGHYKTRSAALHGIKLLLKEG